MTSPTVHTATVKVTSSDEPSAIGAVGTVTLNTSNERIDFSIAGRSGGFGPGAAHFGFIATRADVRSDSGAAQSVTHYGAVGTAVDNDPFLDDEQGDCVAATAGALLTPPGQSVARGGGSYAAQVGRGPFGANESTCFGGQASLAYDVEGIATDGENHAAMNVVVTEGGPGLAGGLLLNEPSQRFTIDGVRIDIEFAGHKAHDITQRIARNDVDPIDESGFGGIRAREYQPTYAVRARNQCYR